MNPAEHLRIDLQVHSDQFLQLFYHRSTTTLEKLQPKVLHFSLKLSFGRLLVGDIVLKPMQLHIFDQKVTPVNQIACEWMSCGYRQGCNFYKLLSTDEPFHCYFLQLFFSMFVIAIYSSFIYLLISFIARRI